MKTHATTYYAITYRDPLTNKTTTEYYMTQELRDARAELLAIMGYEIIPEGE